MNIEGIDVDTLGVLGVRLDVLVNDRRVWSVTPREAFVPWPVELSAGLEATVRVALTDSDGEVRWADELSFGDGGRDDLLDGRGRPVVLNKWGRPARPWELMNDAERRRFLDELERLIAELGDLGYQAFVVGGTLLGAVRSGSILDNDDDADIAWLCEATHPADVALQSFAMERKLHDLGHEVVRHSAAHLQICYGGDPGVPEFYVDIFTAFFTHGEFCEPIHMRTAALSRDQIVPPGEVVLHGRRLPAPADPEAWLIACYGPDWRDPDPSFTFATPTETIRRFHGWFGSQNTHREYWNARFQDEQVPEPSAIARRLSAELEPGTRVIDAGCGLGADAMLFAESGMDAWAVDFSATAISRLRQRAGEQAAPLRADVLNFYDRRGVIEHAAELRRESAVPTVVLVRHLVEQMTNSGRHHLTQWLRWILAPPTAQWW